MIVRRVTTYMLHPATLRRENLLWQLCGAYRYVWNYLLALHEAAFRKHEETGAEMPSFTFFSLNTMFAQLRKSAGHEWLQDLSFAVVRYSLKRLADALSAARKGKRGFPKFKCRGRGIPSLTIPDITESAARWILDGRLLVPKVGRIPISNSGDPWARGVPKMAHVTHEAGKWYAHIVWEVEVAEQVDDGCEVGVDMNVGQVALSDRPEKIYAPKVTRLESRAKRLQRELDRRKAKKPLLDDAGLPRCGRTGKAIMVHSKRYGRTLLRLRKTMKRLKDIRGNFCHHASKVIADAAGTAIIEDLNIWGMTASTKGTRENPGRRIRQKAGLNRSILRTGWGIIRRQLEYKAAHVVAVPPQYTSQTCHHCGHVSADNRSTQAKFQCVRCGFKDDADINAARNVLALGRKIMAEGMSAAGREEEKEALAKRSARGAAHNRLSDPSRRGNAPCRPDKKLRRAA